MGELLAFIVGAITTLLGFGLSVLWEESKHRRDRKERHERAISLINEDLTDNLKIIKANLELLRKELTILKKKRVLVLPLTNLNSSFWDLLKSDIDRSRISDGDLKSLGDVYYNILVVNTDIDSRQAFRIYNESMNKFENRMKQYDEIIIESLKRIEKFVEDLDLGL